MTDAIAWQGQNLQCRLAAVHSMAATASQRDLEELAAPDNVQLTDFQALAEQNDRPQAAPEVTQQCTGTKQHQCNH